MKVDEKDAPALVQYQNGIMMIRFFGTHEGYDEVDAETV
jgi:mRNA interferase HigB